jgi:hypothetical protein
MSKPTATKNKKPNETKSYNEAIIADLLDSLVTSRQATRDLAESVDAWKVTTLVFSIVSIIALIASLLK